MANNNSNVAVAAPNPASYPGFLKKDDWSLLTTLECLALVLDHEALLRGTFRLPGWMARILVTPFRLAGRGRQARGSPTRFSELRPWPDDGAVEDLWRKNAPSGRIMQCRDAVWARLRFPPAARGTTYHFLAAPEERTLSGYLEALA